MSGQTGYKFIIRTNKPLSQKEQELQLADIRSHVIRNTLHSSRRQHVQFVSCNRSPVKENQKASSEDAVNSCSAKATTKVVFQSRDDQNETQGSRATPPAKTRPRPSPDDEPDEIGAGDSESECARTYIGPLQWCKGARVDPFNVIPWAEGQAYEMDLGMSDKRNPCPLTDTTQ
jgi:hypothetical protein